MARSFFDAVIVTLDSPVEKVKGIGPKRAEALQKLGLFTVEQLLRALPRAYQDFSVAVPVATLRHGQLVAVRARVTDAPRTAFFRGMRLLSAKAYDETGAVLLKWFNQPYRGKQLHIGETQVFCGRVDARKGLSLVNPSVHEEPPGILPVYSLCAGLTQTSLRASVRAALAALPADAPDSLPGWLCALYSLCPLVEALHGAHFPQNADALKAAVRRLSFENALLYLLAVESAKAERQRQNGIAFDCAGAFDALIPHFPFTPTGAQRRAMREIAQDMSRPVPMNRLLQGDVGAGKTAVAIYAMFAAVRNGYQAVLMAPTEILAEQHFAELTRLFGEEACLLSGSMRKKAHDDACKRIASGEAKYIVGTHALIESGVRFSRLGLVATDEQHRFGVTQRAMLQDKGLRPDVLVMSATPIPRTLALLLFGDLDVSVLDELPPGRLPIITRYVSPEKRSDMYRYLAKNALEGKQTYIVCPLIEENEEWEAESVTALYERLCAELPGASIGLLHGRMRAADKQRAVDDFRQGRTRLLVTTTVIEVGVHVPNATAMVIESAERFGLSQLHQLRGRVGRGTEQSYCFLLSDHPGDDAMTRIDTMTKVSDGFAVAERDLALRGAGDFLGVRQHGEGVSLSVGSALDIKLLEQAKEAASEILALPTLQNNELIERAKDAYLSANARIAMN